MQPDVIWDAVRFAALYAGVMLIVAFFRYGGPAWLWRFTIACLRIAIVVFVGLTALLLLFKIVAFAWR